MKQKIGMKLILNKEVRKEKKENKLPTKEGEAKERGNLLEYD